ncbi:MAG: LamG-like jellyroll fold domain-containing protein [Gemmatimonadota bacterium]
MARSLTRRRHGRHRSFDRVRQDAGDSLAFVTDEAARLSVFEGARGVHDAMHLEQGEGSSSSFEQVQVATDPVDIGLIPTVSLDFDGVSEQMRNLETPGLSLGTSGDFTWAGWLKRPTIQADARVLDYHDVNDAVQNNSIFIESLGNGDLNFVLFSNSGAFMKQFSFATPWPINVYTFICMTWANSGSVLKGYFQGVEDASPTKIADNAGSRDDTTLLQFQEPSSKSSGTPHGGLKFYSAVWDVALPANAILEIFNQADQADLLVNAGNYTQAANNLHWWRWGFNLADIGKDSGSAPALIDMAQASVGMDASDIVLEVP